MTSSIERLWITSDMYFWVLKTFPGRQRGYLRSTDFRLLQPFQLQFNFTTGMFISDIIYYSCAFLFQCKFILDVTESRLTSLPVTSVFLFLLSGFLLLALSSLGPLLLRQYHRRPEPITPTDSSYKMFLSSSIPSSEQKSVPEQEDEDSFPPRGNPWASSFPANTLPTPFNPPHPLGLPFTFPFPFPPPYGFHHPSPQTIIRSDPIHLCHHHEASLNTAIIFHERTADSSFRRRTILYGQGHPEDRSNLRGWGGLARDQRQVRNQHPLVSTEWLRVVRADRTSKSLRTRESRRIIAFIGCYGCVRALVRGDHLI